MGEHEIHEQVDADALRGFMRALLEDVRALERLIDTGRIETGIRRIGAEQELFLVDRGYRAANRALSILNRLDSPSFTTELGQFNLEANLDPCELAGGCLSKMEADLNRLISEVRAAAEEEEVKVALTGILPTLVKDDLGLDSMTPSPRYYQLNHVMRQLRGGEFRTLIKGLDELQMTHDNVMLEACNTSFQIHFQTAPDEFAKLYNLAQIVTGPVLAAAVNSPLLLGKRLWHETRVALFTQSLDVRSESQIKRGGQMRVRFGDDWIQDSVLEIFREDIARFRVLIATELEESPLAVIERGEIPSLSALRLHNGTVYRWNRPCYGVADGIAHLRIENRVLPSGPTVVDEVANAAFFFGLMCAMSEEYGDVTQLMSFNQAKENFMAAARYGLNARLHWTGGRSLPAEGLVLEELLPAARAGLESRGILAQDVDRYLGVLERRVQSRRTGAQWMLDSLAGMGGARTKDERGRALTAALIREQERETPIADWPLARIEGAADIRESYRKVGQIMQTDLFTTHPEDLIDLAASVMDWEHIRHVPVEDHDGHLVGMVTYRQLLRMVSRGMLNGKPVAVREIMRKTPVTVSSDLSTLDAIALMRQERVGALPVVDDGKLVGIVTESDFIDVSAKLLDQWLREG